MIGLIVKIKTDNTKNLIEWNKDTFEIRESFGLVAIRGFQDLENKDEYYAISLWESKEALDVYMKNEDTQEILKAPVIQWYKILGAVPGSSVGELPEQMVKPQ